jgi:argininosuccinate synthase
MHVSYEGGILEDPWLEPPDDIFLMTKNPEQASESPQYLSIDFQEGIPVAVDGIGYEPAPMLAHLNSVGGEHGIGRVDLVENRFVGMKSRGVYETPGVTLLGVAHRALESITLDREVMHLKDSLNTKISELIYNGFWFSPEFKVIQSLVNETQRNVSGCVRLKLYKGSCMVVGRRAPRSLYSEALATFEQDSVYDQSHATGFIQLNALRLKLGASEAKTPTKQLQLIASL